MLVPQTSVVSLFSSSCFNKRIIINCKICRFPRSLNLGCSNAWRTSKTRSLVSIWACISITIYSTSFLINSLPSFNFLTREPTNFRKFILLLRFLSSGWKINFIPLRAVRTIFISWLGSDNRYSSRNSMKELAYSRSIKISTLLYGLNKLSKTWSRSWIVRNLKSQSSEF